MLARMNDAASTGGAQATSAPRAFDPAGMKDVLLGRAVSLGSTIPPVATVPLGLMRCVQPG